MKLRMIRRISVLLLLVVGLCSCAKRDGAGVVEPPPSGARVLTLSLTNGAGASGSGGLAVDLAATAICGQAADSRYTVVLGSGALLRGR